MSFFDATRYQIVAEGEKFFVGPMSTNTDGVQALSIVATFMRREDAELFIEAAKQAVKP